MNIVHHNLAITFTEYVIHLFQKQCSVMWPETGRTRIPELFLTVTKVAKAAGFFYLNFVCFQIVMVDIVHPSCYVHGCKIFLEARSIVPSTEWPFNL